MKINDILLAKEAITKLNTVKFKDFKMVMQVYSLTKSVNEVYDMVTSERNKIVDLYVQKDSNNNAIVKDNMYQFTTEENKLNYIKDNENLKDTEIDTIKKIQIPVDSIQYADNFTGADMLALDGFIDWI